jgi:hypothetical protein
MADLAAETIAEHLRDRATRSATLAALEGHATPIQRRCLSPRLRLCSG